MVEKADLGHLENFISGFDKTGKFLEQRYGDISKVVGWNRGKFNVQDMVALPWICFEGTRAEDFIRNGKIIHELADATRKDGRNLVIDGGSSFSLVPLELAESFENTTALGIDQSFMPPKAYRTVNCDLEKIGENRSMVAAFQLRIGWINNPNTIKADRVQLVGHPILSSTSIVADSSLMCALGGDFLFVCTHDMSDERELLEQKVIGNLPGFEVVVDETLTVAEINRNYGFRSSEFISSGKVSVVQAVRRE